MLGLELIVVQALLSVFKGKFFDARGKETAIERCEICVEDQIDTSACRFQIRMLCRHGQSIDADIQGYMTKTF